MDAGAGDTTAAVVLTFAMALHISRGFHTPSMLARGAKRLSVALDSGRDITPGGAIHPVWCRQRRAERSPCPIP